MKCPKCKCKLTRHGDGRFNHTCVSCGHTLGDKFDYAKIVISKEAIEASKNEDSFVKMVKDALDRAMRRLR